MCQLTDQPINPADVLAQVGDDGTGGVVLFLGQTRDNSRGEKVIGLEYEAYESLALRQMEKIAAEARQRWPVRAIAIMHRTGYLKIGEISVAIAVACAHRGEAFEACRFAIDTLKKIVPIWKKEFRPDGSFWVEGIPIQTEEKMVANILTLEERIAKLEKEAAALKLLLSEKPKEPWWQKMVGMSEDNPLFDEMVALCEANREKERSEAEQAD
ncbi:molybdenum cofactor biosynthesis protein MoaE [candidate division KSB1 bacterium]|nr:molybdenum cofactor biosynthesis protein MoaE [candidate division KSB1 bacterium]